MLQDRQCLGLQEIRINQSFWACDRQQFVLEQPDGHHGHNPQESRNQKKPKKEKKGSEKKEKKGSSLEKGVKSIL